MGKAGASKIVSDINSGCQFLCSSAIRCILIVQPYHPLSDTNG